MLSLEGICDCGDENGGEDGELICSLRLPRPFATGIGETPSVG